MTEQRKMQAAIICDMGKGHDKTSYYCRECGPLVEPCFHIDGYFKNQVKDGEVNRRQKFQEGERMLQAALKRRV